MTGNLKRSLNLEVGAEYSQATFQAMACPCELLIDTCDQTVAYQIAIACFNEVKRIEKKYSRYRNDNVCHAINNSKGLPVAIDEETYRLLQFADQCFQISDGLFDLTSGVLRQVWNFDGSDNVPLQREIEAVLPLVGWKKIDYTHLSITIPKGMEIDFGGIGKEYAVSRCADICQQQAKGVSVLINLGGDVQISRPRASLQPWRVGIDGSRHVIPLRKGALATSGDSKRFLIKDGVRYSHILNPKSGWPIQDAPSSVTVLGPLCIQAGLLATLALLKGKQAKQFLKAQQVKFWILD